MTTETTVMTILERANPVPPGELVDVPIGATRYLEAALEQRSEPMTIVEPTPTRTSDPPPRRRWPLIAVAASVVAVVTATIALVVANRDDTTVVDQPEPTTPATLPPAPEPTTPIDVGAAQAVVEELFAAYNAGDTDAVMALLAPDAAFSETYGTGGPDPSDVDESVTRAEIENGFAWNHAQGEIWTEPDCELAAEQLPVGATLSCQWDTLDAVVQAVDGEPIPTNALIVVADGHVAGLHRGFGFPDFATLGTRYQRWLELYHPEVDDGAYCCSGNTREEAERNGALWAQWSQEWGDWLDEWGCDTSSCTSSGDEWVVAYDAQCLALDPVGGPTTAFAAAVALIPRPVLSLHLGPSTELVTADRELAGGEATDARTVELQQQRLDAMVELGVDEACHPTLG